MSRLFFMRRNICDSQEFALYDKTKRKINHLLMHNIFQKFEIDYLPPTFRPQIERIPHRNFNELLDIPSQRFFYICFRISRTITPRVASQYETMYGEKYIGVFSDSLDKTYVGPFIGEYVWKLLILFGFHQVPFTDVFICVQPTSQLSCL